jgi:hypothetical protein
MIICQAVDHAPQAAPPGFAGGGTRPVTIEEVEQAIEHEGEPFREEPDTKKPRPHPTG